LLKIWIKIIDGVKVSSIILFKCNKIFFILNNYKKINQEIIPRQLKGFVGFSNLPRQVHNKSIKKGFQFTVMVVGMFNISFKSI